MKEKSSFCYFKLLPKFKTKTETLNLEDEVGGPVAASESSKFLGTTFVRDMGSIL
jgi:hypothetical protein